MALDTRLVQELLTLRSRLREALERADAGGAGVWPEGGELEPAVDVWESAEDVVVEIEVPGARVSDISLRLEGNALVVSGRLPADGEEGGRYLRMERPRGAFSRHLPLPVAVSGDPRARLRNGVLRVTIPKSATVARRTIPVLEEGP